MPDTPKPNITYHQALKLFRQRLADFDALLRQEIGCYAVVSGQRTADAQHRLYLKGRKTPGRKVTNADYYDSPHVWGLARDQVLIDNTGHLLRARDSRWGILGRLAVRCHLVWGGSFPKLLDKGHVELPNWRSHITWP